MTFAMLGAVKAVDVVFYALLALAFAGGLFGGLKRAFKGFYIGVITVLAAMLLTSATIVPVRKLDVCQDLTSSLESSTSDWGQAFTTPIYIARDDNGAPVRNDKGEIEDFYVELGDGVRVSLKDAADAGLASKTKAKTALRLARRFVNEDNDGTSLARYAADALANLIIEVVTFVIYSVAIAVILVLLRVFVFKRMHDSDSLAIQLTDRILGALVAATVAMIVLLLALAIIRAALGTTAGSGKYFATAPGTGYLYMHNPMYQLLNKIFG